jgi:uncharacterized protein
MTESLKPVPTLVAKPATPRPPGLWNAWLTIAWGVGATILLFAVQIVAGLAFVIAGGVAPETILADPKSLESNADLLSIVMLASTPPIVAYFIIAARASGLSAYEYLGLKWPTLRQFLIGFALMAAAIIVSDVIGVLTDRDVVPDFMRTTMTQAMRSPEALVMFVVALAVCAPLQEEIAFRGFFLPGFAASWGAPLALAATSVVWATLHIQYDWVLIFQIFLIGLLLGWIRLWSGSTTLTIILHALVNAGAAVQAYLVVS